LFLSLAAALAPGAAIAHHGWGGYDTSKSFTLTCKILKSTYENPHCEIEMEVDGKHSPASGEIVVVRKGKRRQQRSCRSPDS
jgi:hypothetical protein